MKGEYINFWKAAACSLGFLGLYSALYSAQNIQTLILHDDHYGALGDYSNAIVYLGQAVGSFVAMNIMEKIGDIKTMAWGAMVCLPYIASLLFPAYRSNNLTSDAWFYSVPFVYVVIIFFSLFTGLGEGMAQTA